MLKIVHLRQMHNPDYCYWFVMVTPILVVDITANEKRIFRSSPAVGRRACFLNPRFSSFPHKNLVNRQKRRLLTYLMAPIGNIKL